MRYDGTTSDRLHDLPWSRRLTGLADQRRLFDHSGDIELDGRTLHLRGWHDLDRADVIRVRHEFIPGYRRVRAGGIRGQFPSLGVIRRAGAPLVLDLREGPALVLLVGFEVIAGTTHNAEWAERLRRWVDEG